MNNVIPLTTFGSITVIAMCCVVAVFKMKYDAAARLAQQQVESDSSYRELATQAIRLQEANSALLSDIAIRLASLEKMLKDVA